MPSLTGKQFASYYKNLLGIDQTTNAGVDTALRRIQDGAGVDTSVGISKNAVQIKPEGDTASVFAVVTEDADRLLTCDATNQRVYVGASNVIANTFYQTFSANKLVPVAGEHMVLSAVPTPHFGTGLAEISLGDGTDPATTYDMSTGNLAVNLPNSIFRLPHNVTLDSASVLFAVSSSDDETINFHIMSYAIDTDNGGTSGDLSSGVVVADSSTQTTDRTSIDYLALTIQSADVDAGRVLIGTIESTSTEEVSANMILTYHIR